jgi:pimeloyl-ACP methyl ester carboxylesterase
MKLSRISHAAKPLVSTRAGIIGVAMGVGALATAAWVEFKARRAERSNPPAGQFMDINGVHLHYIMRGEGSPVVLLHGNTLSSADFESSDLLNALAQNHRVIAFDRPGFGHSSRPRDRQWTPGEQSALFCAALDRLGISKAAVVGHSLGAMVAVAMALDEPAKVSQLVLIGGYFYPSLRIDALLTSPNAVPVLGDVMRYTVTALASRALIKSTVKRIFSPMPVPEDFFPTLSREMMLRPRQVRASAEDATFMVPSANAMPRRYYELRLPITLIAGADDQIIDSAANSQRLNQEVPHSELHVMPGTGHMAHYQARHLILAALDKAAAAHPAHQEHVVDVEFTGTRQTPAATAA